MKKNDAIKMIIESVKEINEDIINLELNEKTPLFGDNAILDSMKLVELCLSLEDKADELDFEFNWTSDSAMSNSRSIFRNIETLES